MVLEQDRNLGGYLKLVHDTFIQFYWSHPNETEGAEALKRKQEYFEHVKKTQER